MTGLNACRRFFAEDIQLTHNIQSAALVEALAEVPRERFLPPGPWTIRSETDLLKPLRQTPGDDPRFLYHNVSVAIDPDRMLFNGAPGFVATAIDALGVARGRRVLHVGAGTGYFTALMAHVVGDAGRVVAIEIDADLACQASANLTDLPWVDVRQGDGSSVGDGPFDAILVNAGVTHAEPAWLKALAAGGHMVLPLTAAMPAGAHPPGLAMAHISKGLMLLVTRTGDPAACDASVVTFVAIYSAVGLRDDAINAELGRAMSQSPFPRLQRLRLDTHEPDASCWCHSSRGCWSLAGR